MRRRAREENSPAGFVAATRIPRFGCAAMQPTLVSMQPEILMDVA
jgi:hypothetical protein